MIQRQSDKINVHPHLKDFGRNDFPFKNPQPWVWGGSALIILTCSYGIGDYPAGVRSGYALFACFPTSSDNIHMHNTHVATQRLFGRIQTLYIYIWYMHIIHIYIYDLFIDSIDRIDIDTVKCNTLLAVIFFRLCASKFGGSMTWRRVFRRGCLVIALWATHASANNVVGKANN